jgi:hypothetical protein
MFCMNESATLSVRKRCSALCVGDRGPRADRQRDEPITRIAASAPFRQLPVVGALGDAPVPTARYRA